MHTLQMMWGEVSRAQLTALRAHAVYSLIIFTTGKVFFSWLSHLQNSGVNKPSLKISGTFVSKPHCLKIDSCMSCPVVCGPGALRYSRSSHLLLFRVRLTKWGACWQPNPGTYMIRSGSRRSEAYFFYSPGCVSFQKNTRSFPTF